MENTIKLNYRFYLLLFFNIALVSSCIAQTYKNAFDRFESSANGAYGQGQSFSDNINGILNNTEAAYLEVYLQMYNATKDKRYLDKFIIHSKRVQTHRDDNINDNDEGVPGTTCQPDLSALPDHPESKGWSVDIDNDEGQCDGWLQRVLHSATLTYPMAEFVLLMKTNPYFIALSNEAVPVEINDVPISEDCSSINILTYQDYADWLECRVNETIQYHESFWSVWDNLYHKKSYPETPNDPNPTETEVINMQCAMGKTLAIMYLVESMPGGNTNYASTYWKHISWISEKLHGDVLFLNPYDVTSYTWCHTYECTCIEDIAHAFLVMQFADICFQYNITDYNSTNVQLFNSYDMSRFANTFAKHIYQSPLHFAANTFGTVDDICNSTNNEDIGLYVFLSKYEPDIYQIVSDYFSDKALYQNDGGLQCYSQLTLYENLFNPLAVNRNTEASSLWSGVAGGDFDGNGTQEFVTSSNYLGEISVTSVNDERIFTKIAATSSQLETTWQGITAADLSTDYSGDEIAAISTEGVLHLMRQNNSAINGITNINTGIYSGWTGIAAGNFDGNEGNEMILSNDNGKIYVYRYNGTNLVADAINASTTNDNFIKNNLAGITVGNFNDEAGDEIATINNSTSTPEDGNIVITIYSFSSSTLTQLSVFTLASGAYSDWNGITSGDFDGDGIDEIIAHRNYDGDFFIFKLNDSDQIINSAKEFFPTDQLNGVIGSARFSFDQSKDALISLRNYDGNMFIYNLDGLCPNLYLDDVTVNDDYTIDNPYTNVANTYTADYHASNTLYASNFKVMSTAVGEDENSKVTFTAGKKIIVTPGSSRSAAYSGCSFHAYIDEEISCSQPYFRYNNGQDHDNLLTNMETVQDSSKEAGLNSITEGNTLSGNSSETVLNLTEGSTGTKIMENVSFSIYPNPNNGNMTVTYSLPSEANGLLEFYDMPGKLLFTKILLPGNNTFTIEGNDLNQGIYQYRAIANDNQIANDKIVVIK